MDPFDQTTPSTVPFVESVFFPTDFSPESESAFAHALAISLIRQTALTLLHVGREEHGDEVWSKFPPVRATLERWGLLEPGSPRSAVFDRFAVKVKKVSLRDRDPLAAMLDFLDRNPTDLIVVGTDGRAGVPSWLRAPLAKKRPLESRTMTLFVPRSGKGFVSPANGFVSLRRLLIPVAPRPRSDRAAVIASRMADVGGDPAKLVLLHVGDGMDVSSLAVPVREGVTWESLQRDSGDVAGEILAAAEALDADAILMTTEGRQGVLDALRGSVTEQVVRRASCPVLAIPAARDGGSAG